MTDVDTLPILTSDEQRHLLKLARDAIVAAAKGRSPPQPDIENLPAVLKRPGACFVTLIKDGALRGCTGTLLAVRPLALEVMRCAVQTSSADPRFDVVGPGEVDRIEIEISVLSSPRPLRYEDPAELPRLIRPGTDGVTLYRGARRATFLPQVWERIDDPILFLNTLCRKMELPAETWRSPGVTAEVYQANSFSEVDFRQD